MTKRVKFRCDVIKNNITAGTLAMTSGRVDCQTDAEIHRSASITVRDASGIDLLRDKLKPVMGIFEKSARGRTWSEIDAAHKTWSEIDAAHKTWAELSQAVVTEGFRDYSLGVFVPTSPTSQTGAGAPSMSIEMYDNCVILREDCITERLYFAAGTAYVSAIEQIITSAGLTHCITPSTKTLLVAREWDIGTTKLSIANALLEEINYTSCIADIDGVITAIPYQQPTMARISHTLRSGIDCIKAEITERADYYAAPNVFIAMVSSSDSDTDLISACVNDNPASKLSTVYRGRKIVSEIFRPDGIASQADLDDYIKRKAYEASHIEQTADIKTASDPTYGVGDVIFISHPQLTGVFESASWSLSLQAGAEMTHTVRRATSA